MSISVIIPVFNGEKYLSECLDSIISELKRDDELVIIDDGSTDGTRSILDGIEGKNIKIISQKNQGVSISRNIGIKHAKNDYLLFVDSDDKLKPGWRSIIGGVEGGGYDVVVFSEKYERKLKKDEWLDTLFGLSGETMGLMGAWSKIYSKSFLVRNNIIFRDGIINGEDMLFNIEVIIGAENYCFAKNSFYYYRNNSQSVTHRFSPEIFSSDKRFQEQLSKHKHILTDIQMNSCIENAIMIFAEKIALLEKNKRHQYIRVFREEPYSSYMNGASCVTGVKYKLYKALIKQNMFQIIKAIMFIRKNRKNDKEAFVLL